ncbi:unnamed protein product [Durusdinium trenchii]|uniref:Pentatricopeptide repeat-containing protein, chloroplastic n=1 Tax=Durusdinium trenchii TaxID=1381693 RepID=A0ABP0LGK1_9DINO
MLVCKAKTAHGFPRPLCHANKGPSADRSDAFVFTATMNACVAARKWALALDLFAQMEAHQVQTNKYVLSTCMKAYNEASLWHLALAELAKELVSSGSDLDEILFGVCITACGKAMKWIWALQLLQELTERSLPHEEGRKLAIFACEKATAWRCALELLQGLGTLRAERRSVPATNSVISACGKGRQWMMSMSLLMEMSQKELQADEVSWNSLLSAFEKGTQWQRALLLVDAEVSLSRMALNASISACANASAWKEALAVFESIKEKDVVTYNSSITACTKGRQAGRSLRLFSEMKALQLRPDQVTHGAVLNACEKAALWVEALHLLAQEPPPTIVLVNMVASACEKGHQWQQALAVLQAAKRHRLRADSTTLNAAMAACLRGEEWSRSLEFFHRMQRGRGPTLHSYAEALSSLHQAQRWEDALRLFAEVSHQSDRHVLGAAFRAAALCWPEALLLLDRHDDKLDAVCILLSLAALDQAGQGWVRTTLVERLTKEIVSSLNPGDLTAAVATAVHGVTSVDRGVTPQVLHQASRALWQVVYAPTLRHLGRPGVGHYFDPKISTEWSSLELASRDALVLLDLAAQSRGHVKRRDPAATAAEKPKRCPWRAGSGSIPLVQLFRRVGSVRRRVSSCPFGRARL